MSARMPRGARLPAHLAHRSTARPADGAARAAAGLTVRGLVTAVTYPDAASARSLGFDPSAVTGVLCDVQVIEPRYRSILKSVPIATRSGGVNDHEVWVPRAASQPIAGVDFNLYDDSLGQGTATTDTDGDFVLVQFLGNDFQNPIIVGQVPHPRTKRRPSANDPTKYTYRRYIRGVAIGIKDDGNVEIDLSAASDGAILPDGSEVPSLLAGNLDLIFQPGAKLTVKDSTVSAPERVILGDTYVTDENTLLTAEATFLTALGVYAAAIQAIADPGNAATPTLLAAITSLQTAITTRQGAITTALGSGLPYLSSHLETD